MATLVDLQGSVTERSAQIEPMAVPPRLQQMLEHRAAADLHLSH